MFLTIFYLHYLQNFHDLSLVKKNHLLPSWKLRGLSTFCTTTSGIVPWLLRVTAGCVGVISVFCLNFCNTRYTSRQISPTDTTKPTLYEICFTCDLVFIIS